MGNDVTVTAFLPSVSRPSRDDGEPAWDRGHLITVQTVEVAFQHLLRQMGNPASAFREVGNDGLMPALRPLTEDDLPAFIGLAKEPSMTGDYGFFGWATPMDVRARFAADGVLGTDDGVLVVDDGAMAGVVTWTGHTPTVTGPLWEIGVALLPHARGKGLGTQAHSLVVDYLFAHTTVHRIQAVTEAENVAERRALQRAGFAEEGQLRM